MSPDDVRAVRRILPVRVYPLGREPNNDLSAVTTPEERLAMVAMLTRRMWQLTGRETPAYRREAMPVRVVRPV